MIGTFFSVLKDIVLTLTAITGAFVAVKGLSTWKRQISGQAEYNLSKNLLVNLFKYRDVISSIRDPFMSGSERIPPSGEERKKMTDAQVRHHATSKAYEVRWNKLSEVRPEIYANMIEAEALWGDEITKLWENLIKKENDLLYAIQDFLEFTNPGIDRLDKEHLIANHRHIRRMVFEGGKDDPFKPEFDSRLDEMTAYIKKKIKK